MRCVDGTAHTCNIKEHDAPLHSARCHTQGYNLDTNLRTPQLSHAPRHKDFFKPTQDTQKREIICEMQMFHAIKTMPVGVVRILRVITVDTHHKLTAKSE
jgi:hypothetical protein